MHLSLYDLSKCLTMHRILNSSLKRDLYQKYICSAFPSQSHQQQKNNFPWKVTKKKKTAKKVPILDFFWKHDASQNYE